MLIHLGNRLLLSCRRNTTISRGACCRSLHASAVRFGGRSFNENMELVATVSKLKKLVDDCKIEQANIMLNDDNTGFADDHTSFANKLLVVVDVLEKVVARIDPEDLKADLEIQKMHRSLSCMLEDLSVKKMEAKNKLYDPDKHEAVFSMTMRDNAPIFCSGPPAPAWMPSSTSTYGHECHPEPYTVFDVLEPGYMMHRRILRKAKVGVTPAESGGLGVSHVPAQFACLFDSIS
eukprot:gnl/TRDRNA2_/TRDRNA2_39254_c0_seq1.p1 gnl/TRDRNA2_/TRDRNA2_39254_c0~~gnl/TRDRNA2_/TRDRNA2_39254_c0_seq1.p1  ORF type:complete len:234 (+),score=47.71 gnl/TRDRNA2_/TRDRNA2_39254_c0_seq1:44-745(+)